MGHANDIYGKCQRHLQQMPTTSTANANDIYSKCQRHLRQMPTTSTANASDIFGKCQEMGQHIFRYYLSMPRSIEEVLPFSLCHTTIFDGMVRTMVITCKTSEAGTIVIPMRLIAKATCNVMSGTYIGTNTTFHTLTAVNPKRTIGDEIPRKEPAQKT